MTRLPRPSVRNQRRLTRGMQPSSSASSPTAWSRGSRKPSSAGSVGLAVTFLPALLERNYALPLDPWLGLWITTAVFLHTLGSAGLYGQIGWWDHLTHALSATLVAGVGYTAARAIDLHSDEISIPHRFAFVYIVVVVLSFGVVWELFEFGLDIVADETGLHDAAGTARPRRHGHGPDVQLAQGAPRRCLRPGPPHRRRRDRPDESLDR